MNSQKVNIHFSRILAYGCIKGLGEPYYKFSTQCPACQSIIDVEVAGSDDKEEANAVCRNTECNAWEQYETREHTELIWSGDHHYILFHQLEIRKGVDALGFDLGDPYYAVLDTGEIRRYAVSEQGNFMVNKKQSLKREIEFRPTSFRFFGATGEEIELETIIKAVRDYASED